MVELGLWLLLFTAAGAACLFFFGTAPLSRPSSPSPFVSCPDCLTEVRATRSTCHSCGAPIGESSGLEGDLDLSRWA